MIKRILTVVLLASLVVGTLMLAVYPQAQEAGIQALQAVIESNTLELRELMGR